MPTVHYYPIDDAGEVLFGFPPESDPIVLANDFLHEACDLPTVGHPRSVQVAVCEETSDLLAEDQTFDGYVPGQVWHREIRRIIVTLTCVATVAQEEVEPGQPNALLWFPCDAGGVISWLIPFATPEAAAWRAAEELSQDDPQDVVVLGCVPRSGITSDDLADHFRPHTRARMTLNRSANMTHSEPAA